MKFLLLISTWILTVAAVLHINNETDFLNTISQHELVLVKFFSPGCDHCKALEPEYARATTLLSSEPVLLSQVDCLENENICSRYRVNYYPTLQLFRKGKASQVYTEERTAEKIADYMKKQLLPWIPHIESMEKLEQLKKEEPILVVGYFKPEETDAIEQWKSFASKWVDDFAFAIIIDPEETSQLVLYKQFDHQRDTSPMGSEQDMLDFIRLHSIPLLDSITPSNFLNYVEAARPLVYLFSNTAEMRDELHVKYLPLTKEYRQHFSFVHINATEYPAQAEFLSLNATQLPAVGVHNFKTGARYPWEGGDIKTFLNNIMEERVDPVVKSQAFPVSSDTVRVIVGKEFNQVVFDQDRDVLIQIYAPWCSYSQKLAPVWKQLAESLQGVVVAKMDGTTNDVPPSAGFQINKYPTIKLIKAKTNEVVDYTGDRTLEDLIEFSHKHTMHHEKSVQHEEL